MYTLCLTAGGTVTADSPAHAVGPTWQDPRADLRWQTTSGVLRDAARRLGDAEAVVDGELRLTYRQLDEHVSRAAAAFLAAGVDHGDRVSIWGPNCAGWIVAALGLQRAGGVLVPLNTRFLGEEAAYVLRTSRARVLVTVNGFLGHDYLEMLRGAAGGAGQDRPVADLPELSAVVLLEGDPPGGPGVRSWEDFLSQGSPQAQVLERETALGPEDVSDVLFTSGTTGRPKGAVCTHGQTLRAYAVWSSVVGLREGDRYLVVNPFFHGFGYKAGWLACLLSGATAVPARTLDVPAVLDAVRREHITVLPGTPTLYQTLLEHPLFSRDGVATLRLAVTGAASVPPSLLHRIRDEIGFEHIVTGYGLTESCAIVSMCRYDDPLEVVATSAGHPLPGLEVRIVDPEGRAVPAGGEGEVVVRGYTVMRGYLDDPEATAEAIDADGWLHTGDVGRLDEGGRITITDRLKDMYIIGGFNAYPAEIESLLSKHPELSQVAVIGVPDERMGEVGAAYVVPRRGAAPSEDEIIGWCRAHMANYKVPRVVRVVGELPLNASGKVLKNELRERFSAGTAGTAGTNA
jgi:acyl-CoA synthetase (AMP-forming)/AMP-acid ligase II